jgi:hypothetical protein
MTDASRHRRRRTVLSALGTAGVVGLAGCLGGGTGGGAGGSDPDGRGDDGDDGGGGRPPGGPPLAAISLPMQWDAATLRSRELSGGPPKDGIPSIDEPVFETAAEADWIPNREVVFGVIAGGEARAYPRQILVSHEIVNDTLPGRPVTPGAPGDPTTDGTEGADEASTAVSITYCPLTGTAQGFERGDTTFGVSGRLVNSNLVMYDRETDSRWPQVLATAIRGVHEGRSLREFQVVWAPWRLWRERYPDTRVLSRDTGFLRSYRTDPYRGSYAPVSGYYANERTLFRPLSEDDRLPKKEPVMGVRSGDGVAAFNKAAVLTDGAIEGTVGAVAHLAVADPSLETVWVYRNPDEATYIPLGDGTGRVRDRDGTTFEPDAVPLERVVAIDAMWFAWAGYYPDTPLYGRLR